MTNRRIFGAGPARPVEKAVSHFVGTAETRFGQLSMGSVIRGGDHPQGPSNDLVILAPDGWGGK